MKIFFDKSNFSLKYLYILNSLSLLELFHTFATHVLARLFSDVWICNSYFCDGAANRKSKLH